MGFERTLASLGVAAVLAGCAPSLDDRTAGMSVEDYDRQREATSADAEGAADADVDLSNPGLSDEQSFDAVTARETIESDQARLEAQREAYRIIEPTPVPDRPSDAQPNIVAYALEASNDVGEQVYRRSRLFRGSGDNCGDYASADMAQRAFLASGGPERDREGLDPDGDGFACRWSPEPFRSAVR